MVALLPWLSLSLHLVVLIVSAWTCSDLNNLDIVFNGIYGTRKPLAIVVPHSAHITTAWPSAYMQVLCTQCLTVMELFGQRFSLYIWAEV